MLLLPRESRAWLAAGLLLVHFGAQAAAPDCGPDALPAAALASPTLLGAEDFSASPCATIVGGMAQFVLHPRGPGLEDIEPAQLRVESLDLLEIRAVEMEVVRRLRAQGAAGTAGRAAASSLVQTGEALAGVVTRPVESVIGLPAGMLRVFGRRATRYGRQASDLGERAYEAVSDGPCSTPACALARRNRCRRSPSPGGRKAAGSR